MPSIDHLKVVLKPKQITDRVEAHNSESPADFSYCDISGVRFEGFYLAGANFSCAVCFEVDLEGCNLTGCNFTRAEQLKTANFHRCTMDQATALTILENGGYLPDSVKVFDDNGNHLYPEALRKSLFNGNNEMEFITELINAVSDYPHFSNEIKKKATDLITLSGKTPIEDFKSFINTIKAVLSQLVEK